MKYQTLFATCMLTMALAQTEGIFTDDDHAPEEFIAGYLKEILK